MAMNRRGFFKTRAISALSAVGVGKLLSMIPLRWTRRLHDDWFLPRVAEEHARAAFYEQLAWLEEHGMVEIKRRKKKLGR